METKFNLYIALSIENKIRYTKAFKELQDYYDKNKSMG